MKIPAICICVLLIMLAACSPPPETPTTCAGFDLTESTATCATVHEEALVQSSADESVRLQRAGATFTVSGTAHFVYMPDRITLQVIEGSTVVSARDRTRVVRASNALTLPLTDGIIAAPPGDVQRLEPGVFATLPLHRLPRPVDVSLPYVTPTPAPSSTPPPFAPRADDIYLPPSPTPRCVPREDWVTYTVRPGDTLTTIANRYETTIEGLQQGNCLTNPDALRDGQELRVPADTATASDDTSTDATVAPRGEVGFRVDATALQVGECTALRWDAYDAQEIYLDDAPVLNSNSQRICPRETTTYTLRVVYAEDNEVSRSLTVQVTAAGDS